MAEKEREVRFVDQNQVRFVDKNQVVIPIVWPGAKMFLDSPIVSATAFCDSSEFEVDHGLMNLKFQRIESASPPTLVVSSEKRFTITRTQVLFSSPSGYKIVSHRTVAGAAREDENRASKGEVYSALLKVWNRNNNVAPKSIISLHAKLHIRFAEVELHAARSLSSDLLRRFDAQDGVDVFFTFHNETKELGAHKWLLRTRSEYLRNLFDSNLGVSKFDIQNYDSGTFEKVLVYLYSGDSSDIADKESLLAALRLADEYSLPELKRVCSRKVDDLLCAENVAEILGQIHQWNCESLVLSCFDLLESRTECERWESLIGIGSIPLMKRFLEYMGTEDLESGSPSDS